MHFNRCVVYLPGIHELCRHVSAYCNYHGIPHDDFIILDYVRKLFVELFDGTIDDAFIDDLYGTITYELFHDNYYTLECLYSKMFDWLTVLGIDAIYISELIPISTDGYAIVRFTHYEY